MKCFFVFLCALLAVVTVNGQGVPKMKCPPGEHSVVYCPRKAGPDCDTPTVHDRDSPAACGIPDCFCDEPTVRNLRTGKCVTPKNCPITQCQ